MKLFCAAADWGTTHFRLWLLDTDGKVAGTRSSEQGIMHCQPAGFRDVLESHLDALFAPADLPVVICGMAGSRQGWVEAGYVDTPAALDDVVRKAASVPGSGRQVFILPGIAQRQPSAPDVMRGEETQLLGAFDGKTGDVLVCMPGTHSKWVEMSAGKVTGFTTHLTGELFSVISRDTILSHAVAGSTFDETAFAQAAARALEDPGGLTAALFSIRAGQLLGYRDQSAGRAELSGLLIGTEIATARSAYGGAAQVHLVASGRMATLYDIALVKAGCDVVKIDAGEVTRRGLWQAATQLLGARQPARIS